jgi:hypothetical protein
MSGGVVGFFERSIWKTLQFRSLDDDSSMLNVVYLERMQCS